MTELLSFGPIGVQSAEERSQTELALLPPSLQDELLAPGTVGADRSSERLKSAGRYFFLFSASKFCVCLCVSERAPKYKHCL